MWHCIRITMPLNDHCYRYYHSHYTTFFVVIFTHLNNVYGLLHRITRQSYRSSWYLMRSRCHLKDHTKNVRQISTHISVRLMEALNYQPNCFLLLLFRLTKSWAVRQCPFEDTTLSPHINRIEALLLPGCIIIFRNCGWRKFPHHNECYWQLGCCHMARSP